MATHEQYAHWNRYLSELTQEDQKHQFGIFLGYLDIFLPWMSNERVPCPAQQETGNDDPRCRPTVVSWVIVHLNDYHREWTRERIADWLELTAARLGVDLELPLPEEVPMEPGEHRFKETE